MGSYSKTYKATAAPSVGSKWEDAANIYDNNTTTYCTRSLATGTSAVHINGFGINLPDYAVLNSLEVHTKMSTSNEYGYFYVYVYTDEGPTSLLSTSVVNGGKTSGTKTQTYLASAIQEKLNEKGVCNGNLIQFLKTLRVRFVGGSTGSSALYMCTCNIHDNYVVVNYTIPDITYTFVNYDGTVLKEEPVEQGTEPTPPSDPTRPSTAQYKYTFSGWSLSGTTYTAQYTATKRSYTISTAVTPEGAGTVTGGGSGLYGTTKTLTATANDGYVFTGWTDGNTDNPRTVTIKKKATYTAQFEEAGANKIYIGTAQPKEIYLGTQKVKGIYIGTTAVYET